jgi:hypothetical protein
MPSDADEAAKCEKVGCSRMGELILSYLH